MNDKMVIVAAMVLAALLMVIGPMSTAMAQDEADGDADVEVDGDGEDDGEASGEPAGSTLQRGGRLEFDARLVRGERAGSGAVYLFQRPPRQLPSLIERRSSYLDGTVHSVFGDDGVRQLNEARNR